MADDNGVDNGVSGRLGDVSGRLGDVSGRLGDISGRLGDVSGRASSDQVEDSLFSDRQTDNFQSVEKRVKRVEVEIVMLLRWVSAQFRIIEQGLTTDSNKDEIKTLQGQLSTISQRVTQVEDRLDKITPMPPAP
jgi:hypothetical protein